MSDEPVNERVFRAIRMAARSHDGQRYGDGPYIVHPLDVALRVGRMGGTEDQVVAALLHDTVEDTSLTVDAVEEAFGAAVAALVASLTHDALIPYQEYVAALADDAVLVKLADSQSNLGALDHGRMRPARRDRLTDRYTRNIAALTDRLNGQPPQPAGAHLRPAWPNRRDLTPSRPLGDDVDP